MKYNAPNVCIFWLYIQHEPYVKNVCRNMDKLEDAAYKVKTAGKQKR